MDEPKLKRVRRLDSIKLDQNDKTYFTNEGYLIDHPILTSCGIFEYTNPDGSIRRELRLPEHVFAEESLKTYKGKPIIITHEAGVVNKGNVDREQIGTILTDGYQDGDDVRAEIIIHDTDAMKECGLKELSLGYNLDLIEEPGTWNGEAYDAIQTNISINHLALVANARAGEQARLNIDGSDSPELKGGKVYAPRNGSTAGSHLNSDLAGFDGIKEKGGKQEMKKQVFRVDGIDMTPEQLVEAIKMYKEANAKAEGEGGNGKAIDGGELPAGKKGEGGGGGEAGAGAKAVPSEPPAALTEPPTADPPKKDGNDLQPIIAAAKQLLSALEAWGNTDGSGCGGENNEDEDDPAPTAISGLEVEEEEKTDGAEDKSQALNADSADELFRQRLGICRMGDKLGMDGLEKKSLADGKRAIIAKVLPGLRMDGKGGAYLDAAYDLAVCEVNKRKDVNYQRQQMRGKPVVRTDGSGNESMAASARQRMIDRENGKEGGND